MPAPGRPGELDNTFGRSAVYPEGCSAEQGDNLAPCFGLQFFGRVDIDGASEVMTVTLKDVDNRDLWSVDIAPATGRTARSDHGATHLIDEGRWLQRLYQPSLPVIARSAKRNGPSRSHFSAPLSSGGGGA